MRVKALLTGLLAIACTLPAFGHDGGAGGNPKFVHYKNKAFDFHVAEPKDDWTCEGCDHDNLGSRDDNSNTLTWKLIAKEKTTSMTIDFMAGFPATNQKELLAEIQITDPRATWTDISRGGFVGYSNSTQGPEANTAIEYYFVDKRQVIRIEWHQDEHYPDRHLQLDQIKDSINKTSAPATIMSIKTDRDVAYKVGDTACIDIVIDALRYNFDAFSLKKVDVEGAPNHWSFKKINWEPENNRFIVCYKVTSNFGPTGLRLKKLRIEDDEGDTTIDCLPLATDPATLGCWHTEVYYSDGAVNPEWTIKPAIAPVENQNPDHDGPVIHSVTFDHEHMTLNIDAEDASGFGLGQVTIGSSSTIIYPEQLRNHVPIDISAMLHEGWNTIDSLIIYDANGLPTKLQRAVPPPGGSILRHAKVNETYQLLPWQGVIGDSHIDVISFLKTPGGCQ